MTTEYNRAAQESINLPSDDSGKVDQGKHRRKQTIERRRVIESGNETRVTQNDQIEMRREEERDKKYVISTVCTARYKWAKTLKKMSFDSEMKLLQKLCCLI